MVQDGRERRQHPRVPIRLRVRFPQEDVQQFADAQAVNISIGGMFIQTPRPKPKGSLLVFEIQLKSGQAVLRGKGEVTWVQEAGGAEGSGRKPGMGLKFLALDDASTRLVRQIVKEKLEPPPTPKDASEIAADEFDLDADDTAQGTLPPETTTAQPAEREPEPEPAPEPVPPPPGPNRRVHPRLTIGLIVQVSQPDVASFKRGYALNISQGGIFIRSSKPHPKGTRLRLEIQLQGGETVIEGSGTVIWIQEPAGPDERPTVPGMGIKFEELTDSSRELVEDILDQIHAGPAADVAPAPPADIAEAPLEAPEAAGKAPDLSGAALKTRIVSALVASLNLSRVPELLDVGMLRSLAGSWYQEYFDGTTVDLSILWNTLIAAEEVDILDAALPLEIFHLAHTYHGVAVRMPEALLHYEGSSKVQDMAKRRMSEFAHALEEAEAAPHEEAVAHRPAPEVQAVKRASTARKAVAIVGLVLACAAVGFAVYLVTPTKAAAFDLEAAAHILALKDGSRQGSTLTAAIADTDWEGMTDEQRRGKVREVAQAFAADGIDTLTLLDGSLSPCAVVVPGRAGGDPAILVGDEVWQPPPETEGAKP